LPYQKLILQLKADLENVTDLAPADGYEWHFKIRCNSCNEVDDNWISMNNEDTRGLTGSRGAANLVMRCKFCRRESSAQFDTSPIVPYTADSNGNFSRLVVIDCRGLEPVAFQPRNGWTAKGVESGTVFDDVDLSEGEWADYDEKAEEPVSISEIEAKFVKA
jgi:hypothetical protein